MSSCRLFGFLTYASLFAIAVFSPPDAAAAELAELQTVAEQSDYQATATYDQVMQYCTALADGSHLVTLAEFGVSHEGRSLPLLILSRSELPSEKPWKQIDKPVIFCFGNIHAGEVCGKEALLKFARELVLQESPQLLEHFVLLVAPIYNADGNEQMDKGNRPGQVGPAEGMGQRENAMGLDLNRDYVKLEAPETQAMVRLFRDWDPSVVIDTHTTNGSHHRYTLTYGGPRHPATDSKLAEFVRTQLLPEVTSAVFDSTGYETFFYGNFEHDHQRWTTYPALPRYGAHYVGLRNRIAILSEAYSYAPYKDRVLATEAFVRECLNAVVEHRDEIAGITKEADQNVQEDGGEIAIRHRLAPYKESVIVKGYVEEEQDGKRVATDKTHDYEVEHWAKSETALSIPMPAAYLLSADFSEVIQNLQRHGVKVEQLREDIDLKIEVSRIGGVDRAARPFEGHELVTLDVEREPRTRSFPAGTIVVRTNQPLGRLAALLLEPESEDGLAAWNFFDESLELGGEYPVYRLGPGQTMLTGPVRPLEEEREKGRRVTYRTLYGEIDERVNFSAPSTRVEWMEDGRHFTQTREGELCLVNAITGESNPLLDPSKLAASLKAIPSMDDRERSSISRRSRFVFNDDKTAALLTHGDDLYHLPFDGSPAVRLTRTRGAEQYAQYSPDGEFVAYVRNRNLFVVDIATQTEQAITDDTDENIINGEASWVYFEELYGRNWRAFWWSPDSRHVAFCRFDETGMPLFHAVDTIPLHGELKTFAHPKPGDRNPEVAIGVAHVSGAPVRWIDLSGYIEGTFIVSYVDWRPDGDLLYFYVQDRAQTWLDFRTCRTNSTTSERLFRETTEAWVESPGQSWWVGDEVIFLSERSGWKHLYAFNTKSKEWRSITEGDWEIRGVDRVDEESGWIYFTACKRSPIATDWRRVLIEGGESTRLTQREGSHRIDLAPVGNLAVDSWSSFETQGDTRLLNTDGQQVRMIDSRPSYVQEEFALGEFRHMQIPTEDGFQLEATLTLPPDFDETKQYPVWFTTYGGPNAPQVRDAGGLRMRDQMMANLGIVAFTLDPRSASGKGAQSTWTAYRQLGVQELKDIETGIAWLTEKPYIDAKRVGMSGHSYGGYMTAYAMTHSKVFAAGISGAPVTDWHNYDSIYTERYMDTPQENPDGYDNTSIVKAAGDLHGRLLLLHGLMDDNVHPQNSTQLIMALQRANKDFEVMIYPQNKHGLGGDHYNTLMIDFITESLGLDAATGADANRPADDGEDSPAPDADVAQ